MNGNLIKLGNTEVYVDLEKIKKHIPPIYYERMFPTIEAAKASEKKFYAVINEKDNNYYVSHPLADYPSLINGKEERFGNETTPTPFKDDLGKTTSFPKWIVDILIPIVSKEGKQKVVIGTTKNYFNVKTELREKPEYDNLEFCYVNEGSAGDGFRYAMYNTKIDFVGRGAYYYNNKINYYKILNSGKLTTSKNGDLFIEDGICQRKCSEILTKIISNSKFEPINEELKVKEEPIKKETPIEEEVELLTQTGQSIKVKLDLLMQHIPLWGFSNCLIGGGNYTPPEFINSASKSTLTDVYIKADQIESIKRYQNYSHGRSYRHIAKKSYKKNLTTGEETIEYTNVVCDPKEDIKEDLLKTELVTDVFGTQGQIPKWLYNDYLSEYEKQNIVFVDGNSGDSLINKIKEKFGNKGFVEINLKRKGDENKIGILRCENASLVRNYDLNATPNLQNPAEIKWMCFDKQKHEVEYCLFGHEGYREYINSEVLETKYKNDVNRYKTAIKLYNEQVTKKLKLKKDKEAQEKVVEKLLENKELKREWIFSSKEEYVKNKSEIVKSGAPLAIWFEKDNEIVTDLDARYTKPEDMKRLRKFDISVEFDDLKSHISSRLLSFDKIDGMYRYRPTIKYINDLILKFPINLSFSKEKKPFEFNWYENNKIEFIGEGNKVLASCDISLNDIATWATNVVNQHISCYLPKGNTIPSFLKTITDQFSSLPKIKIVEQNKSMDIEPYDIHLNQHGKLLFFNDSKELVAELSTLTEEGRNGIKKEFEKLHAQLTENRTKCTELLKEYKKVFQEIMESPLEEPQLANTLQRYGTVFGIFEINTNYPTKAINEKFEKQLSEVKGKIDSEFSSYSEESLWKLPNQILNLIPKHYKDSYQFYGPKKLTEFSNVENVGEFPYMIYFFEKEKSYGFSDKNGKIVLTISEHDFINATTETVSALKNYFEIWENEHFYVGSEKICCPKVLEKYIKDEQIKKTIGNTENGIVISAGQLICYINGMSQALIFSLGNFNENELDKIFEAIKKESSSIKKVAQIAESDSKLVAKRLVVKNINDLSCSVLLTLVKAKKDIPSIEKLLQTVQGKAIIAMFSSLLLKALSNYFDAKYKPILNEIVDEMRISAETEVSLSVINFVEEAILEKLKSNPELVRVAVESFESTNNSFSDLQENLDEQVSFFETIQTDNKLVN